MSERPSRNAAWNIAEVVISSVLLFVLYKLILHYVGVSALGIWSLVLATTSIGRVADFGAAGGLARYVAQAAAEGERAGTQHDAKRACLAYIETGFMGNLYLYIVIGAVLYVPAWFALGWSVKGADLAVARTLLPYSIMSFLLLNVAGTITAGLIGLHRSYQKSMIAIGSLAVQAAVAIVLIARIGLTGLAIAQIVQYLVTIIVGWALIVRLCGSRQILPFRVNRARFRELIGFGMRLQALTIASFLFDPLTKYALMGLGGTGALGLYELALRGIMQARTLIIAPTQNLTPMFAASRVHDDGRLRIAYADAVLWLGAIGGVAMLALSIGSPLVSLFWLGHVDRSFVLFSCLLAAGWFVNIVAVPAYYLGIASGVLRWNIVAAIAMTALAPTLGWLGRPLFGAPSTVVGVGIALIAGNLVVLIGNARTGAVPALPDRAAAARLSGLARSWLRRVPGLHRAGVPR